MIFTSNSIVQTHSLAQRIAPRLQAGDILALTGQLGSGKTTFTQGLALALGVTSRLTSPTFIIMRSYPTSQFPGDLIHLDLYRLANSEDFKSFNLEELIHSHQHLLVIEWPEKIIPLLPPSTHWLEFKLLSHSSRHITLPSTLIS